MKRATGRKDGFTLVELMVVISIIALLTSVILGSLGAARTRGNDAQRKADLTRMRIALDLYYDAHTAFPSTGGAWYAAAAPAAATADWIPGLIAGGFMRSLPQDPVYPQQFGGPICTNWPSMYLYKSDNGTGYEVLDVCPVRSNVAKTPTTDPYYDPIRPTYAWKICAGTECSE